MRQIETWLDGAWRQTLNINLDLDCEAAGLDNAEIRRRLADGEKITIRHSTYRIVKTLERQAGEQDGQFLIRALETYGPRTIIELSWICTIPIAQIRRVLEDSSDIILYSVTKRRGRGKTERFTITHKEKSE